jgi:hypothetical protein
MRCHICLREENFSCLGKCAHLSDVYCNGERGFPIFEKRNVTQGIYVFIAFVLNNNCRKDCVGA